jgi:hypothetical protein
MSIKRIYYFLGIFFTLARLFSFIFVTDEFKSGAVNLGYVNYFIELDGFKSSVLAVCVLVNIASFVLGCHFFKKAHKSS